MNLLLAGALGADERTDWAAALRQALPGHTLHLARSAAVDPLIDVAIVANPAPGGLAGLPGLRLIQSLWAGVDRLLADTTLPPGVAIARMVDPAMTAAMAQTALWATLALHRGFFNYAQQQQAGLWRPLPQCRADEWPVLVLGFGQMGRAVALRLAQQGYPVTAWRRGAAAGPAAADGLPAATAARSSADVTAELPAALPAALPPALPAALAAALPADPPAEPPATLSRNVTVISGAAAPAHALAQARTVINLLPLTPDTRGLIDAGWLAGLRRGAGLVNLARGAQVVDADLLAALDSGQLGHAVLDVFATEPLPAGHRFWQHRQVTVLPHAAALTDMRSAAALVARNIDALAAGQPLHHRVVREAGY